jgi:hypothetical protein
MFKHPRATFLIWRTGVTEGLVPIMRHPRSPVLSNSSESYFRPIWTRN